MTREDDILNALRNAQPPLALPAPHTLTVLQTNAYRFDHGRGALFVKWIAHDDADGLNEIHVNGSLLSRGDLPTPRLVLAMRLETATVAAWEWLEGDDLRADNRHLLPAAFAQLGRFHLARRHAGQVLSPTTRQAYPGIRELLDGELAFLCAGWGQNILAECRPLFALLTAGYPTLIHGDMHPGNLRATSCGLFFVDWSSAMPSLNLFDLDYVHSVALLDEGEPPWWNINVAESHAVLSAYFAASGLPGVDRNLVHRAVMLWCELRSHYNALQHGNQPGALRCRRNVLRLLAG